MLICPLMPGGGGQKGLADKDFFYRETPLLREHEIGGSTFIVKW